MCTASFQIPHFWNQKSSFDWSPRLEPVPTKLFSHLNTKSFPPFYSSNTLSLFMLVAKKNHQLKPIPSAYPLSFILLITSRSLFSLPKDFINCSLALSPLHNYGPNITCCPVVILNRSTFYSQKCSNLGNKLYSRLGYNHWCLQQANVSLSISDFLMPYLSSFNDIALQPTLIIHSHDPTLKVLTKYCLFLQNLNFSLPVLWPFLSFQVTHVLLQTQQSFIYIITHNSLLPQPFPFPSLRHIFISLDMQLTLISH